MFPFRMLKVREAQTQANRPPAGAIFIAEGTLKHCSVKLTCKPREGQVLSLITNGMAGLCGCQVSWSLLGAC